MLYDHAYCINLKKRPEKKELSQIQFDKIGIDVEFIEAIDGTELDRNEFGLLGGYQGLSQTLINIIDDAIASEYTSIRIFEDDIEFDENHVQIFEDNKHFIPVDFSVLYLGCTCKRIATPHIGGRIYKVRRAALGHDFIIKSNMFDLLKTELIKMEIPSDMCLAKVYRQNLDNEGNYIFKAFCFRKGISFQRAGFSDNMKRKTKVEVD